jgi:hypothetical protein
MNEKDILEITQGMIEIVRAEQLLRETMQRQIDGLTCEVGELRTEILKLRGIE